MSESLIPQTYSVESLMQKLRAQPHAQSEAVNEFVVCYDEVVTRLVDDLKRKAQIDEE